MKSFAPRQRPARPRRAPDPLLVIRGFVRTLERLRGARETAGAGALPRASAARQRP
ncbi:MAG TPA: hypothetical protein VIL72_08960 [Beijerinckiaceae bacterium]|jgi:hypothetical protein